jgi:hypothetical protein
MYARLFPAALLGLGLLAGCSTQQDVMNISDVPIPVGDNGILHTHAEVRTAISEAAKFKRWLARDLDEDTIVAEITVRDRHHAEVSIDYSESSFAINLLSSSGLEQKDGRIHRNYNKWVSILKGEILYQIGKLDSPEAF